MVKYMSGKCWVVHPRHARIEGIAWKADGQPPLSFIKLHFAFAFTFCAKMRQLTLFKSSFSALTAPSLLPSMILACKL